MAVAAGARGGHTAVGAGGMTLPAPLAAENAAVAGPAPEGQPTSHTSQLLLLLLRLAHSCWPLAAACSQHTPGPLSCSRALARRLWCTWCPSRCGSRSTLGSTTCGQLTSSRYRPLIRGNGRHTGSTCTTYPTMQQCSSSSSSGCGGHSSSSSLQRGTAAAFSQALTMRMAAQPTRSGAAATAAVPMCQAHRCQEPQGVVRPHASLATTGLHQAAGLTSSGP